MTDKMTPPPGFRFDPFADVRQGRSLFELRRIEDWLVPDETAALSPTPQPSEEERR